MANPTRKTGKKNRKYERNKKFCERYRLSGTREKNKARRLRKHLERFPRDLVAKRALKTCVGVV